MGYGEEHARIKARWAEVEKELDGTVDGDRIVDLQIEMDRLERDLDRLLDEMRREIQGEDEE